MAISDPQLLQRIRVAGVIGAGGAGFPTYKKLESQVEHLIANGAECEPLLQKDRETMLQQRDAFFEGLDVMRRLTGARQVTIALKRKNADIADAFRQQAERDGFEIFIYEDVYPAGDEYVLVYEITGRQIPPDGIPLDVETVVDNVETIVNVAHAAAGQPVTDKFISIAGAVGQPLTTIVPVGTRIEDCLALSGGCTVDEPVVLTGGLMMGGVAQNMSEPITKTTAGLIVLPADHYLVQRKTASRETYTRIGHGQCDQCSLCTELCPRYLLGYPIEPHRVMRTLLMTGTAKQRGSLWAQHCCECNICSLVACPEQLDPKNICVDAKAILKESNERWSEAELATEFRPAHPARKGREIPIDTLYQRLGLTPYDRKAEFAPAQIEPATVEIRLDTHIGQPAKPVRAVGDVVRRGEVIASVDSNQLGCPVHASMDGRISSVSTESVVIARK
jgi:Na+-translocating ferredoxin:NAD+ oxidoreductase RnfC subunit